VFGVADLRLRNSELASSKVWVFGFLCLFQASDLRIKV